MKFKIAIIAHNLRIGGGLVGMMNLLKGLKNVASDEQVLLICSARCGYEQIELPAGSEIFIYKGGHSPFGRFWFEKVTLPKIVKRYNPDAVLGMGNIGLTKPWVPQALLIHHAYLFYDRRHYPDIHLRFRLRISALKRQVRKSLSKTKLVYCQTPVVKQRFSERFRYPESRIKIMRWPVPVEMKHFSQSEVPSAFNESSDNFYILLLTRYMPHRNPSVLVQLCMRYGETIRSKQIRFITTVEPNDDPQAGKFLEEISKYHLEDVIINVGRLSRKDVSRYYSHSHVLWLPTTAETLCLPFLEAMTMGVPVLTPDFDFARYVCGDAALFYDPKDIESVFRKIVLLREDTTTRKNLIKKGKKELGKREKFAENWEQVAEDLIQDLRRLAEQESQ